MEAGIIISKAIPLIYSLRCPYCRARIIVKTHPEIITKQIPGGIKVDHLENIVTSIYCSRCHTSFHISYLEKMITP